MLIKTHLLITISAVLIFISGVENKLIFVLVALLATFAPDIDSRYSTIGRPKIARVLQVFTKHRGVTHSFSFLLLISFFLVLFFPIIAFPFFLGYGLHLFADSFTKDGITPFYPYRKKTYGRIRTGGKSEIVVLVVFLLADLGLFGGKILGRI